MEWLPPKLQSLQLRWFILTAAKCPTHLSQMRRLSLERCASSNLQHFQNVLEGLPSLSSLDLEDILDLSERHIMHIRPLTQLTSLSVVAIGNHHITNSMLGLLTTLTGLRRLKWHAGDMLDSILDPAFLKAFPNLFVLSLTTSMFYRMTRWSALNVMDFLPYCQLETIGP
ncbi:hypothetical protein DUNSADRAFT_18308 [Dunaliella salina]|uniref:Uncharacterized protein n=1 Tax=Dunaliella salina TaxID=3046 RepID=A0ABQ7GZ89_DUNSA|nr:hypothetical protein DUNSADRAFT_18308 [Dunaliella salina]|eukprot:KAF5839894.1 hypothetical protein DUNSADRAFT_18308 [Dunaliella salina]